MAPRPAMPPPDPAIAGARPDVSVIVPLDFPGEPIACAKSLMEQDAVGKRIEVLVVDTCHGVTWRPSDLPRRGPGPAHVTFEYLRAPRGGRALAFNFGLARSRAPLVLLLAGDFIAEPGLVRRHLEAHAADPSPMRVVVGPAFFTAELRSHPMAAWLEDSGRLFGVSFTRPRTRRLKRFFWVANASLKRELLDKAGPFDETFDGHAMDDYEMGVRLGRLGAQIQYDPEAKAIHNHPLDLEERRGYGALGGRASLTYDVKYRGGPRAWIRWMPRWPAAWIVRTAERRALRRGTEPKSALYVRAFWVDAFLRGYHRALRDWKDGRPGQVFDPRSFARA